MRQGSVDGEEDEKRKSDALLDDALEVSLELLGHGSLADLGEDALLRRREVLLDCGQGVFGSVRRPSRGGKAREGGGRRQRTGLLPRADLVDGDAVEETVDTGAARGGDAGQGTVVEEANEGPGGLGSLEGPESRERARPPSDRERATD